MFACFTGGDSPSDVDISEESSHEKTSYSYSL